MVAVYWPWPQRPHRTVQPSTFFVQMAWPPRRTGPPGVTDHRAGDAGALADEQPRAGDVGPGGEAHVHASRIDRPTCTGSMPPKVMTASSVLPAVVPLAIGS